MIVICKKDLKARYTVKAPFRKGCFYYAKQTGRNGEIKVLEDKKPGGWLFDKLEFERYFRVFIH